MAMFLKWVVNFPSIVSIERVRDGSAILMPAFFADLLPLHCRF
jgi:hypothetical protein